LGIPRALSLLSSLLTIGRNEGISSFGDVGWLDYRRFLEDPSILCPKYPSVASWADHVISFSKCHALYFACIWTFSDNQQRI